MVIFFPPRPGPLPDYAGIHVDELFTHDACTVYRFRDGRYHYYVRCKGDAAPTTLACLGKNCKDDDAIPTLPAASR